MAVKKVRNHGTWTWRPRVVYRGQRRVAYRATKDEARQAEQAFYREVRDEAAREEQAGHSPATLRALLDLYVQSLEDQRKSPETSGWLARRSPPSGASAPRCSTGP